MDNLIIGRHFSIEKGIDFSIRAAKESGCNILQIFCQNPKGLSGPSKNTLNSIDKIKIALNETNIIIVSHSPYCINLAKDPDEYPKMYQCLLKDLLFSDSIGSIGSVVHMGKYVKLTPEEGLSNMKKSISKVLMEYSGTSQMLLETPCHQGTELCNTIEEIAELYHSFTEEEQNKIGFCIDTCHVFAAGYDFRSKETVQEYFQKFNELIGPNKIKLIHYNDSKTECNSHKDRHENIGEGYIGNVELGGKLDGLKEVIIYARDNKIPVTLETPVNELFKEEIQLVKTF